MLTEVNRLVHRAGEFEHANVVDARFASAKGTVTGEVEGVLRRVVLGIVFAVLQIFPKIPDSRCYFGGLELRFGEGGVEPSLAELLFEEHSSVSRARLSTELH